jgi:hypothetical protein
MAGRREWSQREKLVLGLVPVLALFFHAPALSADLAPAPPTVKARRLSRAPTLDDFLSMNPPGDLVGQMARVEGFIQRSPSDGQPATQKTEVYVGYDDKKLYVVFVCFDEQPEKVRARMVRREDVFDDDFVVLLLDTFADQRRAYEFIINPFGIQADGLRTEGQGYDGSFDTLWESEGRLTDKGYVVWIALPFKSLRFSPARHQIWGIIFQRAIPRNNEDAAWPHVSSRIEGRLNQAATLEGLENISPGRNIQLIPFGAFRSFRALDTRDDNRPDFVRDRSDPDVGLDAKFIFKDSLVLDVALNPDFSQVESDDPQTTVNQRFEVFFPEKRPFFLENANFFQTPINLVFTRRIADPQFGARLTGKLGPYALGAFLIDDESPGKRVPEGDPREDKRALFAIVRASRDIFRQSSLGFIYTDREFEDDYNRVGGLDGRFKLSPNWVAELQAVTSWTRATDDNGVVTRLAGPAYDFEISRVGRSLIYELEYNDRSPGFSTETGFLRRPDIRRVGQFVGYRFWPEGRFIVNWGPEFSFDRIYDHAGNRLDWEANSFFGVEMLGRTFLGMFYNAARERLRPQDFDGLTRSLDFSQPGYGFTFESSYFSQVTLSGFMGWGKRINFAPPDGSEPFLADESPAQLDITVRPTNSLRVDNTYLLSRLTDRATGDNVFNNHILRSKWNYQFTRELSLRVILQYDATLPNINPLLCTVPESERTATQVDAIAANPGLTSLCPRKNFNADFLITYLLHPGTALFIGYNGNARNIDLVPTPDGAEIVHPRNRFINDAKQFFVKFSYLYRF